MTESKVKLIKTKDWSGQKVISGGIVTYKTEDGKRMMIGLNFSQEGLTRSSSSSTDYSYVQVKVKTKNYICSKTLLNEKYLVGDDTWRPGGNSTSWGCQSFDQFLKSKNNALEMSLERSEYANLVPFVKQARADILDASIKDREKTKNKEQFKQGKINSVLQKYSSFIKKR